MKKQKIEDTNDKKIKILNKNYKGIKSWRLKASFSLETTNFNSAPICEGAAPLRSISNILARESSLDTRGSVKGHSIIENVLLIKPLKFLEIFERASRSKLVKNYLDFKLQYLYL